MIGLNLRIGRRQTRLARFSTKSRFCLHVLAGGRLLSVHAKSWKIVLSEFNQNSLNQGEVRNA